MRLERPWSDAGDLRKLFELDRLGQPAPKPFQGAHQSAGNARENSGAVTSGSRLNRVRGSEGDIVNMPQQQPAASPL